VECSAFFKICLHIAFSIQLPGKDIFNIPGYRIQLAQELLDFCVHKKRLPSPTVY